MNPGNSLTGILIPVMLVVIVLLVLGSLAAWWLASTKPPARKKGPESRRGELLELLRLYRQRNSKALSLEVGGRVYRSRSELTVNQVDQLSVLLGELLAWLGKPELAQRAAESRNSSLAAPPAAGAEPVLPGGVEAVKNRPRLLNPLDALMGAVAAEVPQNQAQPKSIATQIDEILQAKLARRGMEQPRVRLVELPEGGVAVAIGREQYSGLEEIPDETIRGLIRESVTQWEMQEQV